MRNMRKLKLMLLLTLLAVSVLADSKIDLILKEATNAYNDKDYQTALKNSVLSRMK